MIERYVATGIARYEFRYYPHLGDATWVAAGAVSCASEQGAFWLLHDRFMANDATLFTEAGLRRQITFEGLDYVEFVACMTEGHTLPLLRASRDEGAARGVAGTPTVFVNDEQVDPTLEAIEAAIERAIGE